MTLLRRGGLAAVGLVSLGLCKLVAAWGIARWQGAAVQGAFSLALACSSLGAIVLGMGIEYANSYVAGRDEPGIGSVVTNTLVLALAALCLAPLWVGAFGAVLPGIYLGPQPDGSTWLAVAAATGLTVAVQGLQAAAIGRGDIRGVAVANLTLGLFWCAASLVASQMSYRAILFAWLGGQLVQTGFFLRRLGWNPRRDRFDGGVLRRQRDYGLKTLPGSVSRALNMRTGMYVASLTLSRETLGVYGLLVTLAEALLYLPSAFGQVILGSPARDGDRVPSFRPAYLVVGGVGLVATIVATLAGGPLLTLVFGRPYGVGALPLAALLMASTVHAVGLLRLHAHLAAGRPGAASRAQVVALGFTVAGAAVLIPGRGLMGAAVATLIAYTAFAGYLFSRAPGAGRA